MKAIIPVAGIGSRLRPHTHTQPKSLIPVAGKPILGHIMDKLTAAGINDFVFIIGYLGDKLEQYIKENYPKCNSSFVIQTVGKGTGHAIWLARDLMPDNEELFIVFGDTIFEVDLEPVFNSPYSMLGVKRVEDPRLFGVAELDEEGFISKLVEKPQIPKSNQALVGLYKIKEAKILKECLSYNIENEVKTQNEFHLTDALMCMIQKGIKFKPFELNQWFDCGKKDILLQTNQVLLNRMEPEDYSKRFKNTIIVPPVFIGADAQIRDSIIGPNVSVGYNANITRSMIKNSIIGPYAELENAILDDSLIGSDAQLIGTVQSLNLGDSAEINYGVHK